MEVTWDDIDVEAHNGVEVEEAVDVLTRSHPGSFEVGQQALGED